MTGPNAGGGDTGFQNNFINLTLDVGSGNAGAIGIDYNACNQACIENVTIRANDANHSGKAGLYLGRDWPGPCFIKNLEVDGFDYGVWCTNEPSAGITFSHLKLYNQNLAGLQNDLQVISIEDLYSSQSWKKVPAIKQDAANGYGLITLIGATCLNGDANHLTIALTAGHCYLRQISTDGSYHAAILERRNHHSRSLC